MTPENLLSVRDRIQRTVENDRGSLIQLSQSLGNHPELAFEEFYAANEIATALEKAGFEVTREAYGLATAIEAVYGTGSLTVALVAEYDALPGIGHGCGHNVIAAAGVGAAVALRDVADLLDLRIKLLGTPAEEKGGGKIIMLERGAWDDADFSLMVHGTTGPQLPCIAFTSQSLEHLLVTFTGRTAHAAAAPHEGINAADAATLTQVALGLLRQQLKSDVVVASFIEHGGDATNIIPDQTRLQVEVRATDATDWQDASTRVRACIGGAALATGCLVEIQPTEQPYAPMLQQPDLAQLWDTNIEGLGYDVEAPQRSSGGGSTDMGNISQYLPSIHPSISFKGSNAVPHTIDFATAAISEAGDDAVINGAMALALTVASAANDKKLRAQFNEYRIKRVPNTPEKEVSLATTGEA